ncbi:MAG: bifunctional UDP-3-O-[3-hydroxymyristoyl] N-acetylglucosamine deacetylase/3-hydroxyacyl-ACP dehydratase [Bacteroidales bacterium]|nr:bifunctional UDP-3-O-[3-hydroxymyristoyl] N-acetylglucosamine deacetylase/3-hydroxyacyl-ACP dehydratase [Bacteroidales bacterium]
MSDKQRTISTSVSISGKGLHNGTEVTITFNPAPVNHGYKFRRIDIETQPIVEALAENVVDTSRGTTIEQNGVRISTIEHALAALVGMGIDNAIIDINSDETPILDGSSIQYVQAIDKVGVIEQEEDRIYLEITENIEYTVPEKGIELLAVPASDYALNTMVDYDSKVLIAQHASLKSISRFKDEIAACKTFVFLHEMEPLIKAGLIKGGDLDNALIFVDKMVEQKELDRLSDFFRKPRVEVLSQGVLNNVEMKFDNEPARHKLLDVIGDLALVGRPIKGKIFATRPGHGANVAFAKKLRQIILDGEKNNGIPKYDPNAIPKYDINAIKNMLPHRFPFLLVDKILEVGTEHVIGVKNVTMNEPFFMGHFPEEPVMPGVLQIEAMGQCGGILVLSGLDKPEEYATYFMKIQNVKFRKKVVPGDTLIFSLRLISPIRRGLCHMKGEAYVGDQVVMEAEMLAQVVKK